MKKVLVALIILVTILCMVACDSPQEHKHTVTSELIVIKEATCTEEGQAHMFCTECGEIVNTITISKLSHSFGEWEIIKEATQSEDGLAERHCICGEKESKVLHSTASKGLEFALNDDGESYSVVGIGICTDTDIVIPSEYNNLPVTAIGEFAFASIYAETGELLPSPLLSITIPDSVTSIGGWAFTLCISLTSVVIGNSVETIGDEAFRWCISLTSIEIPDSTTSIGYCAFDYCTALESVEIGNSLTSIGFRVFDECTSLKRIDVDSNNQYYKSIEGNFYSKDGKTLIQYAIGKEASFFTIPDSVTSIGDNAFSFCTSLEGIEIPDSVISIGSSSFGYCTSLISIEIPDSVTSIDSWAFANCTSLINIGFKGTVEQWNAIDFNGSCYFDVPATEVKCSNGTVKLK